MSYEVRYPDQQKDRHLTREQALEEMREFASLIEFVDICPNSDPTRSFLDPANVPGKVFIGVFTSEPIYDDWVRVESTEFRSSDVALEFLREAGLVHLIRVVKG